MTLLKTPTPLLIYQTLISRTNLLAEENQRFKQLHKGFIGEKRLMSILETSHHENVLPMFNCLFEVGTTEFQIDCILLTADRIYL